MKIDGILSAIDTEIQVFEKAKRGLTGNSPKRAETKLLRPAKGARTRKMRKMSAEGKARIAAGQKARWERQRSQG